MAYSYVEVECGNDVAIMVCSVAVLSEVEFDAISDVMVVLCDVSGSIDESVLICSPEDEEAGTDVTSVLCAAMV